MFRLRYTQTNKQTVNKGLNVEVMSCIVLYWVLPLLVLCLLPAGVIVRFVLTNVYLRYHLSEPICMEFYYEGIDEASVQAV